MFLICYLAHDETHRAAVQDRVALAKPPMALIPSLSVPELINQVQTLPVTAVVVDLHWPQATWLQLRGAIRNIHPDLPVLALADGPTDTEWWRVADDLLRLDESLELFLYRLERIGRSRRATPAWDGTTGMLSAPGPGLPSVVSESTGLLENAQFRQFAEIFACTEEPALLESFVGWVQQACQTTRVAILLRDPQTGDFVCRAQRGLPSTLVPHCAFPQTSPLCRWLSMTGRILVKDYVAQVAGDVTSALELMQMVAAIPVLYDGQLVGILAIGSRLIGNSYSPAELEGLFAFSGQIAVALHHRWTHRIIRTQQEMTERVLSVMPAGVVVLGEDNRIAFANAAAATIVGKSRVQLANADLRALPSPLGDLAFETLVRGLDLPRRELDLLPSRRPVAVSGFPLGTTPPTAMLLLEDLSAQKQLVEEHERRVDLEVVTNLVHYLAHELRNPLVSLSTFGTIAEAQTGDPEFKEFCSSVLQAEIRRVNLILEQLLVLTNHMEFQFTRVDLNTVLDRATSSEELRTVVMCAIPLDLPTVPGDPHRIETAVTCILRTAARMTGGQATATFCVTPHEDAVDMQIEVPVGPDVTPEWLLDPWQQLLEGSELTVDFGLPTAHYIITQHHGTLDVSVNDGILVIAVRLPITSASDDREEQSHDSQAGARR